jgi:hypothetical protein
MSPIAAAPDRRPRAIKIARRSASARGATPRLRRHPLMVAPEPSPPAGRLSKCTISAKAAGTVAPQATAAEDRRDDCHACVQAVRRSVEVHSENSGHRVRALTDSRRHRRSHPAHRCSGRAGGWRSPLGSSTTGNCSGRGRNRSRRGADARAARDASGQSGPASRAARQVTAVRQVPFCEPQ